MIYMQEYLRPSIQYAGEIKNATIIGHFGFVFEDTLNLTEKLGGQNVTSLNESITYFIQCHSMNTLPS